MKAPAPPPPHYFVGDTELDRRCKRCDKPRRAAIHLPAGGRTRPMSADRLQAALAAPTIIHDLRRGA